ncbi:MAG: DUF4336 domain-containing protein [Sandaracinaceae bacterium]
MLEPLTSDLWVVNRPLRFLGVSVGTRMTVARLADGGLALHSPVEIDDDLAAALARLGPVRMLVAPNRFHHLYLAAAAARYPDAEVLGVPGLERKRPDVAFSRLLTEAGELDAAIGHAPFTGVGALFPWGVEDFEEQLFLHAPSGTLVVTDSAYCFGPDDPAPTRFAMWMLGAYGRLGPSRLEAWGSRRAEVEAALEPILAWDFDRVIPAHGRVVETGGKAAFRAGYEWLLGR